MKMSQLAGAFPKAYLNVCDGVASQIKAVYNRKSTKLGSSQVAYEVIVETQ